MKQAETVQSALFAKRTWDAFTLLRYNGNTWGRGILTED